MNDEAMYLLILINDEGRGVVLLQIVLSLCRN